MNIKIKGDGNAIGDGNRIFVDKRTIIQNKTTAGGDRRGQPDDNPMAAAGGAAVVAIIALAVAAYKFALYAPSIYLILKSCALAVIGLNLVTTTGLYNDQPRKWLIDQAMSGLAVVLVALGVWMSAGNYRVELTQLAHQAVTWKGFVCGLSPYGKQLATYHMLAMSVFAVPGLMLALIGALGALARWIFFITGIGFFGHAALLQRRGIAIAALVFSAACLVSQFDFSQAVWAGWFDSKQAETIIHYLCPGR